ncbi:phospholipase A [Oceanicoccus sp. KOV_DT_Chl]|uniref:phospholipase A n=1 Tax=Oceanicoccus sp. KOV_DT_Chl TaxID=1904639 RepID=UPI001F476185|nr:phospholipase A [Oceanicoccus sp. KOV_DT_Chl]
MKPYLMLLPFIFSGTSSAAETFEACLLSQLQQAADNTTVKTIRNACKQKLDAEPTISEQQVTASTTPVTTAEEAVSYRLESEDRTESNPFTMSSYRPNYMLIATYNDNIDSGTWNNIFPEAEMDAVEAKFQLSFKTRIAKGVLGGELWGAYSQQSWWQLYNSDQSAPFRETNYEPEIFLRWDTDFDIAGFNNSVVSIGFNHESNGRGELLSRSWNRIITSTTFAKDNLLVIGRAWYRLPEDEEDDDNPDILEYMGYGDLQLTYKWDQQNLGVTLMNNLRKDNKGAIQLDWTFPVGDRFKGYIQYYNGYGESLIDHDVIVRRIGVGVLLNDWL